MIILLNRLPHQIMKSGDRRIIGRFEIKGPWDMPRPERVACLRLHADEHIELGDDRVSPEFEKLLLPAILEYKK